MGTLARDLKHALRSLRESPAFTVTALAVLALGIGANAAIFSVIDTVPLKPLDYPDPGRIVQFMLATSACPGVGASEATFNVWRKQTAAFDDVCGYNARGPGFNLRNGSYSQEVQGSQVTADCFRLFGAPIALGRGFREGENQPGARHVAVLSNGFWKQRFGAEADILGKTVLLNGQPYTVVGILSAAAHGHPLGATGAVLMTKLVNIPERTGGRYGSQSMCIGFGTATASIIERIS